MPDIDGLRALGRLAALVVALTLGTLLPSGRLAPVLLVGRLLVVLAHLEIAAGVVSGVMRTMKFGLEGLDSGGIDYGGNPHHEKTVNGGGDQWSAGKPTSTPRLIIRQPFNVAHSEISTAFS